MSNPLEIPARDPHLEPYEATMDLWIEGAWGQETIAFRQILTFDFDRFQYDDRFAHVIGHYISNALEHLAGEVEALSIQLKPRPEREQIEACMD